MATEPQNIPRMFSVNLAGRGQFEISMDARTGNLVVGQHTQAGVELIASFPGELVPALEAFIATFAPFEQIQVQQTPTGALVERVPRPDGQVDTVVTITGVESSPAAGGAQGANGAGN